MIRDMSVRIVTSREVKGPKWAESHPMQAEDLWVEATVAGKRRRKRIGPPTPDNQREAARKRAAWAALLDAGEVSDFPTFREASAAYLRSGLSEHARSTVSRRNQQLGVFDDLFGDMLLDQIEPSHIIAWADEVRSSKGYDLRTVIHYIESLVGVFSHASRAHPDLPNPAGAARRRLSQDASRTASWRSRNEANKRPLSTEESRKLVAVVTGELRIAVHLLYECGLRIGEAQGLEWGDCWFGGDDLDTSRHLRVFRQVDGSGKPVSVTKTGRSREVVMSRRLRSILLQWRMSQGRPGDGERILQQSRTWLRLHLRKACKAARVRPVTPKDFRDTFASVLIQHGITLKWVSLQLGHSSIAITEQHYAQWLPRDGHRNPWIVPAGSHPTDLFAAIDSGPVTSSSLSVTGGSRLE